MGRQQAYMHCHKDCCFAANVCASRRLRPYGLISSLPGHSGEISIRGFEKAEASQREPWLVFSYIERKRIPF